MSIYNSSFGILKVRTVVEKVRNFGGRIHLIGTLGVGMRAIAELLLDEGIRVSGSDVRPFEDAQALVAMGLEYHGTHGAENISGASLVAYSLAISEENPEYVRALESGIPTVSRSELAAALTLGKKTVCVAGTHGKSTVTAMLAHILKSAGRSPSVLSGAEDSDGRYGVRGDGDEFIVEACEYKDSFLSFSPYIAVVNNIELDHTDYFLSEEQLKNSFALYASKASYKALVNIDDSGGVSVFDEISAPLSTFGVGERAFYRYTLVAVGAERCIFSVHSRRMGDLGEFELHLPGIFNASNATAAISAAIELGVSVDAVRDAIATFRGIKRRLEYIGEYKSRPVFYDYAHHPTEILAGIDAVRALGHDPVSVVFKSHTYSRTHDLLDGFVRALSAADYLLVGDIFAAREERCAKISPMMLAERTGGRYFADRDMPKALDKFTRGTIIIMGAADMSEILKGLNLKE